MKTQGGRLACVLFAVFILEQCSCQPPSTPLPAAPSSVVVSNENGDVFIAAGTQLLRLNSTLELQESVTVSGGGELVRIALSPDGSKLVGCVGGDSRTCLVYNSDDLDSGPNATIDNADYATENGLAVIAISDSFYLGSEETLQGNDRILLSQYQYASETVRTREYNVLVSGFDRYFYGGFTMNGYVYYFVADQTPTGIRVLRVCDCAHANGPCSSMQFDALYELTLQCIGSISVTTRVCGVHLLESFADQNEPLVVMTQCDTAGTRNRACAFLLSDIDNEMDTYYEVCRVGTTQNYQPPWDISRQCSQFNPTSVCQLGATSPAIHVDDTLFGFQLINLGSTLITASLALKVEDVSLLYVARSDSISQSDDMEICGNISVYEVETTSRGFPTGVLVDTISDVPAVRDLSWAEGSDYITVTTDDRVFLHPLEMCSELSTCEACTGDEAFPLCGWCTVENKCSRRSQCQDSSEGGRWVQSSAQCITTSVTPDQFVLERPTIISVTASPSLPSNLSYNCSFSGGGDMFPLVVEAVEVTAGSEYQCNITAAISDLGTVKQVTGFSFVAVEVGIPFATNESALTFYDCDAASSCGECVDTDNGCGWCLYRGLCSGTPDPCPTPPGVNNSYLMLGSSVGFDEVCPVLSAASTPSGHYTQPVRVARNLTLQTLNLPPPVDGFQYVCGLGGQRLETSLNVSEGTVSCGISEGMIVASSPGQEVVSLELIWTNGSVEYSLDEVPADDVMCILYNCSELASSCSSCLGSNVAGFDCGWCSEDTRCTLVEECSSTTFSTSTEMCPLPEITSVQPARGPVEGGTRVTVTGTDLGAAFSDVLGVRLLSGASIANCSLTGASDYVPGLQIVCETEAVSSTGEYNLEVELDRSGVSPTFPFQVEQPVVSAVSPVFGPKSGGIEVMVSGSSLDTGNSEEARVQLNGVDCEVTQNTGSQISCLSAGFDDSGSPNASAVGPVQVFIDNAVVDMSGVQFEFRDDPVYISVSPQNVIPAGGISLTFSGMNLDVFARPVFVFTDPRVTSPDQGGPCMNTTEMGIGVMMMTCVLPNYTASGLPTNISYTIRVGAAPGPDLTNEDLTLNTRADPVFITDGSALEDSEISTGEGGLLKIKGSNLASVERSEIRVTVGGEECTDRGSAGDAVNTYVCAPPDLPPGGTAEAQVVVFIGQTLRYNVGILTYIDQTNTTTTPSTDGSQLAIIIGASVGGGVVVVSVIVVFFVICCFMRRAKEKDKQFTNLLAQMELWEMEMADECKRAFTELQTDLADLVQISDDKNLPYRDFRSFAMRFLFPSAGDDHPVLNPLAITNSEEAIPHLETFRGLILDRKFLLLFVRTLEAQQGRFSLQDKCNVASLLMVAFQNDLDYATDILKTLLSEVMHHAVSKSHPKLLLRRTETVAEKMLANWLSFLLFPYLLDHAGEPLFILFRAIKSQLEKGPVDVITGEARHSLSEEKLLRQKFDSKPVDGLAETESGELIPIKLLDCDTITQAKEKILDVLYKNTAASCRPQLTDVDLELRRANAGIQLRDHDQTNLKEGDWIKINTLGHYRLAEMSQAAVDNPKNPTPRFKLVRRQERPMSGISYDHVGTIIANLNSSSALPPMHSGPNVFHLVKPDQGDADEGTGPRQGKILSEVFLTRLLSTKRILQPYVDDLFKAIFAVPRGKPLPKAIKCLFDFLDLQAADLGIQDPEILHTWKTNSLPLRFWVNLIKNPDFVFDIHKSATVDACLTIIAQAYIDACSTADIKYTKDTPSARLLYVNEVKSYKQDVQQYYGTVQSLPKLSDYDMAEYLRETAQVCAQSVDGSSEHDSNHVFMTRQLYFVTESALYELFRYAVTYSDELQDALNEEGLSVMATKLEQLQRSIKV